MSKIGIIGSKTMKENIYGPGNDDYGRDKWKDEQLKKDIEKALKPWTGVVKSDNKMVRAKFKVEETSKNSWSEKVVLTPVMSGSPENDQFFKTTPSGKIEMAIKNPEAMKQFEVGKDFYVDFTPVE